MLLDMVTVKRLALLSNIAITDENMRAMKSELNTIMRFVEQLMQVNVDGVEPMESIFEINMHERMDKVTDGNKVDDITANAPAKEHGFFIVPKVLE
ncbi:Asp-tRNA(Asn)/Glu-tRNA(Gln) amidotransferase subunit GatC [Candidatus Endowatersipora endosymbiont of Watersipora subatra]|uniref:Asp-tRNA(Asn)/Glu-tRNA(Gln) amidotransferase subunit GatC n=1 Tax=Candidatus Endowatersipora endosymbiont of Watersipora subatra TaxID=3077946 RepID=UPI00312CBAE4